MNAIAVRRLFILEFSRWPPFEREPIRSFGDKRREGNGWVGKRQNLQARQAGIVLGYFRPRKEGREFRIILAKQERKEARRKEREVK